jgi:NAD(P)-dependent dehydrogenase (short-subunit alcohol dehydrogenase family)
MVSACEPHPTPYDSTVDLEGRVVVVTGAARGIGLALARRFHAAGARGVVLADVLGEAAATAAAELRAQRPDSAIGVTADISTPDGNAALVAQAEAAFGPIDLFFANAGVGIGLDLDTPDEVWQQALAINVMSHVYAARLLVPGWVARGEGYFCSTASAAGLLSQIGSAPYSVTKHAAVAFAEWLSITYGDRGVRVSCLCPMGVNTAMLNSTSDPGSVAGIGSATVRLAGPVLEPDEVAEVVHRAIGAERFLILPHPDVQTFVQRKVDDVDRWLAGMRRLQARVTGAL